MDYFNGANFQSQGGWGLQFGGAHAFSAYPAQPTFQGPPLMAPQALNPQVLGQVLMQMMQILSALQSQWSGLLGSGMPPNPFQQQAYPFQQQQQPFPFQPQPPAGPVPLYDFSQSQNAGALAGAGGAQAQAFAGQGNVASVALAIAIAISNQSENKTQPQPEPAQQDSASAAVAVNVQQQPEPAKQDSASAALAVNVRSEVPQQDASLAIAASVGGDGGDGGGGGDGGDPIILDLNGDNQLDVTGKDGKKIDFNLFGNGTPVKTEWLKAGTQDGLLVSDFNGDGQIDSGRELMRTTGVNGEQGKYQGGWDKLSQLFDQNHDGKVAGKELEKLQVWVDKDGDGKSEEGELRSVSELGISQIDVPTEGVKSTFTKDGKKQLAEDYVFDLDT